MPIYIYRCDFCGTKWEASLPLSERSSQNCPRCGLPAERDYSEQNVAVVADIEPYYNIGLDEHISSRRDLREKLAYHNAYTPDIERGGTPNDGRLLPEERAELEGRQGGGRDDLFSRRESAGWGSDPQQEDLPFHVYTEGKADYEPLRKQIRATHAAAAKKAGRETRYASGK